MILDIYCRVTEGRGLQQTASPTSHGETWSVNPFVRKQTYNLIHVYGLTGYQQ